MWADISGTPLTPEQIEEFLAKEAETIARRQKVVDEIQALIGVNVLTLSDAQRWKLVAAVFYKLGVINSNGNVNPYNDWVDV